MQEIEKSLSAGRWRWARYLWQPSLAGLYFGGTWLALTFTPSLIPRPWLLQGALGGIAFALGYEFGVAAVWLWNFLELPVLPERWRKTMYWLLVVVTAANLAWYLWHASNWQNGTRALMGMPDVEAMYYFRMLVVVALVAMVLIGMARLLANGIQIAARIPRTYVQRRIASVVGGAVFIVVLVQLVNGTLVSIAITWIDEAQAAVEVADPPGATPPGEPTRSGSPQSLVAWDRLGKAGKQFVDEGPRRSDIEAFTGKPALDPVRIYAGLRSADGTEAQAALALEELKRADAFSREVLVIATPTGTGWVDNAGIAPLEYMHAGNTAVVGVQYSCLQSPLSLILDPGRSQASAAIVFQTIYRYWKLRWIPVITFLQVGLDMLSAASVPAGHGHNYAAAEYAQAWAQVAAPEGWTQPDTGRLLEWLNRD